MITLITVLIIIHYVRKRSDKKHKDFVIAHSIALKELKTINEKYHFHSVTPDCITHSYDYIKSFEQISCQDYLIYQLQFVQKDVLQKISLAKQNKVEYDKYVEDVGKISNVGNYDAQILKLKKEKLRKIEHNMIKIAYIRPQVNYTITVILRYEKMNGKTYNRKSYSFDQDEVRSFIMRVNNKHGYFFNDKDVWNAICRVERGKVSNRMRFDIYERDGHRCCRCGVHEVFDNLEIDHIVPISKGGKSEYHNLQSLCHRCNLIKGTDTTNYRRR